MKQSKKIMFSCGGKDYFIEVGETLKAYVQKNGTMEPVSKPEDITNIEYVLDSITPRSERSIEVDTIKLGGETYKIYMDTVNFAYFFLKSKNEELVIPEEVVVAKLNAIYNHNPEIVYEIRDLYPNLLEEKLIRIYRNNSIRFSSILISATLMLSMIPKEKTWILGYGAHKVEKVIEEVISENEKKRQYDKEDVQNAIDGNDSLSDQEKDLIYKIDNVIKENYDYIDYENALRNLSEMYIEYYEEIPISSSTGNQLLADYTTAGTDVNRIRIFGSSDLDAKTKTILFHELIHSIAKRPNIYRLKTPFGELVRDIDCDSMFRINYLEELATEVISRSYFKGEETVFVGYNKDVPIMFSLCEIIGKETIRKYCFELDASILVDELAKIDGDKTRAYQFLTKIPTMVEYLKEWNSNPNDEEAKNDYMLKCQEISEGIKYYYETKYARPIESDIVMDLFLVGSYFSNEAIEEEVKKWIGMIPEIAYSINRIQIDYLSDKPVMIIEVTGDGETKKFKVTDENRILKDTFNYRI